LQTGFDWYRSFGKDAEANSKETARIETPLPEAVWAEIAGFIGMGWR